MMKKSISGCYQGPLKFSKQKNRNSFLSFQKTLNNSINGAFQRAS